jgi:tetratricopeptide (TPR) repeat protein
VHPRKDDGGAYPNPDRATVTETETAPQGQEPSPNRRKQYLMIVVVLAFAIAISGVGGYLVGNNQGLERKTETVKAITDEQFDLALEDLDAGRFDIARQRLEYISNLDPSYPQVAEHLAVALLALNAPTATPIPQVTPTPNLAPVEDLINLALSKIAEEDWTSAIEALLTLRAKDPTYRSVDVDGLLFTSLRNRGMLRITLGLMEEGLYDLSLASRFGPLDLNAINLKSLAEQYLLANSYYGLNWAMAAELFAQLCFQGATSDSCYKYGFSSWSYGDLLYSLDDPCGAEEQYQNSLNTWDNPEYHPTATKAADACRTATAPAPTPIPQETETPEGTPSEQPTETPTPTPDD